MNINHINKGNKAHLGSAVLPEGRLHAIVDHIVSGLNNMTEEGANIRVAF